MAKQGMKRPERTHTQERNNQAAVPEIQGKAKHGKKKAGVFADTRNQYSQSVCDTVTRYDESVAYAVPNVKHHKGKSSSLDKPISDAYAVIDTDLARDNLENDITAADLQDL